MVRVQVLLGSYRDTPQCQNSFTGRASIGYFVFDSSVFVGAPIVELSPGSFDRFFTPCTDLSNGLKTCGGLTVPRKYPFSRSRNQRVLLGVAVLRFAIKGLILQAEALFICLPPLSESRGKVTAGFNVGNFPSFTAPGDIGYFYVATKTSLGYPMTAQFDPGRPGGNGKRDITHNWPSS